MRRIIALAQPTVPTVLAILTVLLAVTLGAIPARAADPFEYVALGDSYAAGVGAPGAAGWCLRSPHGYPQLWKDRNTVSTFSFVACGAATTDDVLRNQVSALHRGTDLVSITIGGNDAGFAPTVISCVVAADSGCTAAVRVARAYIAGVLPGRLDTTYAAVRRRAPDARVVVLGYPRLFDVAGGCGSGGMSLPKRRALNAAADQLAEMVRSRAAAAGFTYADVRAAFDGHGICGSSPWINALSALQPLDSFHPNAAGYAKGYLPAMAAATG
jgi:lysophospholipase L1-like esterase